MTSARWLLGLILLIIIYFWEGWVRLLSGIIRSFNSKNNQMALPSFENIEGEGIVSFKDPVDFYSYLLVNGERIFEYGSLCGTCGIVFRKVGSPLNRVSDPEAVELLGDLSKDPTDQTLQRLARVLEPGTYHPIVIEGTIQYIEPGSPNDYFATDVVRHFGLDAFNEPAGAWTPYYRFGSDGELMHPGWYYPDGHSYKSLVTAIVMPLHDPSKLNRERVEYWKQQHENGMTLTAFGVSVVDSQSIKMFPQIGANRNYQYGGLILFTNCLLDGHHRIQAAAELGSKARILSLVSWKYSLIEEYLLPHVVRMYSRKA